MGISPFPTVWFLNGRSGNMWVLICKKRENIELGCMKMSLINMKTEHKKQMYLPFRENNDWNQRTARFRLLQTRFRF